jgi:excisionase family DNA binding protein
MDDLHNEVSPFERPPFLVDEREAARFLGVSPRTIWTLAANGELPTVKIGRRKMYSVESLKEFVLARESRAGVDERPKQ